MFGKLKTPEPVPPAVLSRWRERLAVLHEGLWRHPEHPHAWLWRVQFHIIAYLLGRYAGEHAPALPPAPTLPVPLQPATPPGGDQPAPPASANPWVRLVPPGTGKPPRTGADVRDKLYTIAGENRERYAALAVEAQREKETALAYIRERMEEMRRSMEEMVKNARRWGGLPDLCGYENLHEQAQRERNLLAQQLQALDDPLDKQMIDALTLFETLCTEEAIRKYDPGPDGPGSAARDNVGPSAR